MSNADAMADDDDLTLAPEDDDEQTLPPVEEDDQTLSPPDIEAVSKALSLVASDTGRPDLPGYRLEEPLGEGAFGEVWRATREEPRQVVAVKILRARDEANLAAMAVEVERLQAVAEHPHVVTLLDARLHHHPPFMVTPLLRGPVSRDQATNVPTVVTWFREVAEALRYVHAKGILHCDLKPANILLDEEGHVRLVDFGQAAVAGEGKVHLGTLWFMPPEQAPGHAPEVSWDIYALGATMYQLLSGQLPRMTAEARDSLSATVGAQKLAVYQKVLYDSPLVPLRTLNPQVDADLAAIIEHCLAADAAQRYGTAADVLEDLRRRDAVEPLLARPRRAGDVAHRFVRRHPWPVALFVVLLVVVALSFVAQVQARNEAVAQRNQAVRQLGQAEFQRGVDLAMWLEESSSLLLARSMEHDPRVPTLRAQSLALRAHPRMVRLLATSGQATDAGFSPDGKRILTGSEDGHLQLWDATTGQSVPPALPTGPAGPVLARFSHDGRHILALWGQGPALVLDATTGQVDLRVPVPADPAPGRLPLFSPDDASLLAEGADGRTVVVLDVRSGAARPAAVAVGPGTVQALAWSPDGTRVAAAVEGTVCVAVATTGRKVVQLRAPGVEDVAFSDDGAMLATQTRDGVRVWDARNGQARTPLLHDTQWTRPAMQFSPSGTSIYVLSGSGTIHEWSIPDGEDLSRPVDLSDRVLEFSLTSDGWLVTHTPMAGVQTWNTWLWGTNDVTTGRHQRARPKSQPLFSPDDRYVVITGAAGASVWDVSQPPVSWPGRFEKGFFSPDGKQALVAGGDRVSVLDTATGQGQNGTVPTPWEDMCVSADGRRIAWLVGQDVSLADWPAPSHPVDISTAVRVHLEQLHGHLAFNADGSRLLTAAGGVAQVWDAATGRPVATVPDAEPLRGTLVMSPDRTRFAVCGRDGAHPFLRVCDAATGASVGPPLGLQGTGVWAAVSPDNRLVAVVDGPDSRIEVFTAATGSRVSTFEPASEAGGVRYLAFVPGATPVRLVTASTTQARTWDASTGDPLTPPMPIGIAGLGEVRDVAMSGDGTCLAIASHKGVQLFDPSTGKWLGPGYVLRDPQGLTFSPDGTQLLFGADGDYTCLLPTGYDLDAPPDLVAEETEMWTGCRLDSGGAPRPLTRQEWLDLSADVAQKAEQHASHCLYRRTNVWLQDHGPSP